MKKQILSLLAIFVGFVAMSQVCVPDPSFTVPGIYPVNGGSSTGFYVYMPDAEVGLMYNEVVQIKVPVDTLVDTTIAGVPLLLTAPIVSIKILSFDGLPSSLSYQCDNSNCKWAGGDNGCATFTGTPLASEVGLHIIDIVAFGKVDIGIFGVLTDTLRYKMELKIVPKTGINEFLSSSSVKLAPNPFTDISKLSFQSYSTNNYTLRLIDITGRTVRNVTGETTPGFNEIMIDRNALPNGLYFFSLEIGGEALTGRMAITN